MNKIFIFAVSFAAVAVNPTNAAVHVVHVEKKNVLVVVDSQEDYWASSSSETVWGETATYLTQMRPNAIKVINGNFVCEPNGDTKTFSITEDEDKLMDWDAIVVTQDWLPYSENFDHLIMDTKGAQVMESLENEIKKWEVNNKKERIVLKKTTDDWFTLLVGDREIAEREIAEKRESDDEIKKKVSMHYQISYDGKAKFQNAAGDTISLYEQLLRKGYDQGNTKLSVTGIAMNRCVCKGAAHATALGYEVEVIVPATSDQEDQPNNYRSPIDDPTCIEEKTCNGVDITDDGVKICSDGTACEDDKWLKEFYEGFKGGPRDDKARRLLQAAGVNLCVNAPGKEYNYLGNTQEADPSTKYAWDTWDTLMHVHAAARKWRRILEKHATVKEQEEKKPKKPKKKKKILISDIMT